MASVFTMIINGDIPGRFIWKDEKCVAFLTIEPIGPGHTLIIPREEIDQWTDVPEELASHLFLVSQRISKGIKKAFNAERVGMMIAGFEVPHTHLHVFPSTGLEDFSPAAIQRDYPEEKLDAEAEALRGALRELDFVEFVPEA